MVVDEPPSAERCEVRTATLNMEMRLAKRRSRWTNSVASRLQGSHQAAKKLITSGRPRSCQTDLPPARVVAATGGGARMRRGEGRWPAA